MNENENSDHDGLITAFQDITGAASDDALKYLEDANWELQNAASAYFVDEDAAATAPSIVAASASSMGPRTLDGRPAPPPQTASRAPAAKPAQKKKGIATLGSLASAHGHGHPHSDDESDDGHDNRSRGDLFAGGEKSGLAVQDPNRESGGSNKIISDILAKAKANASRAEPSQRAPSAAPPSTFRGQGQTVGGDGVPSRIIPDPFAPVGGTASSAQSAPEETAHRTLHLWRDGFSVDDGELRRFDDPAHAADLAMIREGRAPLHLMDARFDQPVDVHVERHAEHWHQLPRIYRPFGGEGRRLGSPLPGVGEATTEAPAAAVAVAQVQPQSGSADVEIDDSQPVITMRIQLPDGRRVPVRFNTTHRVEHIYDYVGRAAPETRARNWVLATTFPTKEHIDRSQVLGEMSEFKKGGTAVVKWV